MALILVIDDELPARRMVQHILEAAKHSVIEAEDGDVGLSLFQTHRPRMVIADILMPIKDGIETIKTVGRLDAGTRIIAISGGGVSGNMMFLDIAKTFGAHAVLGKPFGAAELLEAVDRLLAPIASA